MILDLLHDRPGPLDRRADVCVVGAGAAGICLTVDLVARGHRVLLLEGGGRTIEPAAQEPYRSEVSGHPHLGVHTGRFRAHGGTTTRWGGQVLELEELDFAPRPWVAASGWPIAKSVLAPYYRRALELEGLARAIPDDAVVWRRLGLDPPAFPGLETHFSRWCPEPNFARRHAAVLRGEHVRVWLHANAVDLELDGSSVRGLCCRTQEGRREAFTARSYVFCLGGIESVRFFLQPRDGGSLWNRSGLVGRHFQDHLDAEVAQLWPRDRRTFGRFFENVVFDGLKYHPKLRLSESEQREHGTLNCAATMVYTSEAGRALGEVKTAVKHLRRGRLTPVRASTIRTALMNTPLTARQTIRYLRDHRVYQPADAAVHLRVHCEQEPAAASSITLAGQRDSLGLWRARMQWHISDVELHTIRTFARTASRSLASVAEVALDPAVTDSSRALSARCRDSNHHMGGMRMDDDPAQGVVDTDLRLHGTSNCFVCSSAVFPTSGFSNPTHTVLALAMRLAERVTDP